MSANATPASSLMSSSTSPHGLDDQRVAIGIAAVLVMSRLRRSDNEQPRLDRSRPEQHLPMRPPGRNGERGGNGDHLRTRLGQSREQAGKPKIVADRQAEPARPACPRPCTAPCRRGRRRSRASSRRSADRRRTNGSCRSAREPAPRVDHEPAIGELAVLGAHRQRAEMHPQCRALRRLAAGGEDLILFLLRRLLARPLGITVEQARHFRREQHRRAARRRLIDRSTRRSHWPPDRCRCCDWKRAILTMSGGQQFSSLPWRFSS